MCCRGRAARAPARPAYSAGPGRRGRAPSTSLGWSDGLVVALLGKLAQHGLEILGLAEIAVDGREADIGDIVERLEPFHDQLADLLGGYLVLAQALDLADKPVDEALDAFFRDRALAKRDRDRAMQLVAVERHLASRPLHDRQLTQLDPLERREAPAAVRADAAAAGGGRILGGPAVLDLRFEAAAIGALHPRGLNKSENVPSARRPFRERRPRRP